MVLENERGLGPRQAEPQSEALGRRVRFPSFHAQRKVFFPQLSLYLQDIRSVNRNVNQNVNRKIIFSRLRPEKIARSHFG